MRNFDFGKSPQVPVIVLTASLSVLIFSSTSQSQINKPCQGRIDAARTTIRAMRDRDAEIYAAERKRCGTSSACIQRVRKNAGERQRALGIEQARLTQGIRDCEAEAKREQNERARRTAQDLNNPNTGTGGNTEMRYDPELLKQTNPRTGSQGKYRVLGPQRPPRSTTYSRKYPGNESPVTTRTTRQPPTDNLPTTPSGDWDPTTARPSQKPTENRNKDGDWVPPNPNCQGLVDYSRERIRMMQNAADADNKVERLKCGRDLTCLNRAKEHAAERTRQINAEQGRLNGVIRECEDRWRRK